MSVYQKTLICIFRSMGLLGLGYLIAQAIPIAIAYGSDFKMFISFAWLWVPHAACLLLLFLAAAPLARIITKHIEDA
jgi:hypothetical protein